MKVSRTSLFPAILLLILAGGAWPFSCESKGCRDVPDTRFGADGALYSRCVFAVDSMGESVGQYELLYPRCDFYVNTEPSLTVKSGLEGEIKAVKFNTRLNEKVYQVIVKNSSPAGEEGWVSQKKVFTLLEIFQGKEENAREAGLTAALTVTRLDRLDYRFDLVFKNGNEGIWELFFNPLSNTATHSPPFEVRSVATGEPVRFTIALEALAGDDWAYVAGQFLYRKIWPGAEWPLRFRIRLDETAETQFAAVVNYLARKELDPGEYWNCASPLVLF